MNNIMVCVTKQKTCQRLIDYGKKMMDSDRDQLYIIHVADSQYNFLGNSEEGKALEYLYEKSREVGANLTVEKSDDVLTTLAEIVNKNNINKIIAGESGESSGSDSFLDKLENRVSDQAKIIVVPAIS